MVLSVYERRRIGALSVLTLFALTIFSFAAGGASSTTSTTGGIVVVVVEVLEDEPPAANENTVSANNVRTERAPIRRRS